MRVQKATYLTMTVVGGALIAITEVIFSFSLGVLLNYIERPIQQLVQDPFVLNHIHQE